MLHPIVTYRSLPPLARAFGYVAAAAAAWLVVRGATALPGTEALALFGWQRVVVVHVLLTLPVAAWLAAVMPPRIAVTLRPRVSLLSTLAAGAIAIVLWNVLPTVAVVLEANGAGFATRVLVRFALCLTIELPLCVTTELLLAAPAIAVRGRRLWSRSGIGWGVVTALAALALPAAYAGELCRRQTALAADLLQRQQPVLAGAIATRLCALGSSYPLADMTPAAARHHLDDRIASLEESVRAASGDALDVPRSIERARALAMLDRGEQACQILAPLAETDTAAALLLAAILQHRQRWPESTARYRAVADALKESPPSTIATAGRVRALDGIAFNARETGQYAEAEAVYLQGLAEIPAAAAHFHFQLGRHYQLGGMPFRAAAHVREAATLAPQTYAQQAQQIFKQLSTETPGCVLGLRPLVRDPQRDGPKR